MLPICHAHAADAVFVTPVIVPLFAVFVNVVTLSQVVVDYQWCRLLRPIVVLWPFLPTMTLPVTVLLRCGII
jgi:hypothetical protein